MSQLITAIDGAKKMLAESKSLFELVDVRDKAAAVAVFAKSINSSLEAQNEIAEIKLIAERRAGQLLSKMVKKGRPKKADTMSALKHAGVSQKQSTRWQQEAKVPEKQFKKLVKETTEKGEELTQAALLKVAKKNQTDKVLHSRDDDKKRKTAHLKNSLFEVRKGDFREVLDDVAGVSLVLTDPPYPKKDLPLWEDLAKWAAKAMQPDGILVAYSGQMCLPDVFNLMSKHLTYWWTGCVVHAGNGNLSPLGHPVRKVINQWKPLVMFIRNDGVGYHDTFKDLVAGVGPQKTDHNWQQPVEEAKVIIERFSKPGDLVVDPFAGSGGFCKAASELKRKAIGAEIL